MVASLLTFLFIGLVALVVLGVALALVGIVFSMVLGLAGFLLFKVVPIVLIGYLIVRFLTPRDKRLASLERKWLRNS